MVLQDGCRGRVFLQPNCLQWICCQGLRQLRAEAPPVPHHCVKVREWVRQRTDAETKEELVKAFKNGVCFSVVIDEWTSINNRRFLNVCVVTIDSCVNLGLACCRGSMTAIRTVELLQVNFKTTSTVGTYGLRYTAGFVPNYLNPELRICLNFSLSRYHRYLL